MFKTICEKYSFSGHETFQCKSIWLKKGYDFVQSGKSFNDDYAVVELGVGKNMVASIRFWLKSFGITDEGDKITSFGQYIFDDNKGCDPFLEDINTLWLLHYSLISTYYATIYRQVFIFLHKERKEFTKYNIFSFIKRQFVDKCFGNTIFNENTINKDISTLLKMYTNPNSKVIDDYSSVLLDLNLIKRKDKENFEFNYSSKADINPLVLLYGIKDICENDRIIEYEIIHKLSYIFCLSQNELYDIFKKLHEIEPSITYDNSAGEQLFIINKNINKRQVLDMYYNK